ncbi:MAG: hypothetical protein ACREKL_13465 [Chthoniobacterales bacterium]
MGLFRLRSIARLACAGLLLAPLLSRAERAADDRLVSLCEPAKLVTLSKRGAIPRVQKIVYWLEMSRREGKSPGELLKKTMIRIGWDDERGKLTAAMLLRNLDIATKLGCTDAEGMEEMRRGHSPTVKSGPYAGDQLSVDHIVPVSKCPQLDNVLANLELMPLKLNIRKSASIGQRQRDLLIKFESAGLLRRDPMRPPRSMSPTSGVSAWLGMASPTNGLHPTADIHRASWPIFLQAAPRLAFLGS